jgi:hypothetical protein
VKKEAQSMEWKQSLRDEHLKWVCGFANAEGTKNFGENFGTNFGENFGRKFAESAVWRPSDPAWNQRASRSLPSTAPLFGRD